MTLSCFSSCSSLPVGWFAIVSLLSTDPFANQCPEQGRSLRETWSQIVARCGEGGRSPQVANGMDVCKGLKVESEGGVEVGDAAKQEISSHPIICP
ncbi:MAG: hypothetical protein JWQ71_4154 [Pedosphaera sp.]|nr:hypothetical protein [Pedosphaera sp.]